LKEYLDREQSLLLHREPDFVDGSPKIKPLEGTTIQDSYSLEDQGVENRQLINDLDGEDSDSGEDGGPPGAKPDGMLSITQYWKPESGNIMILTTGIAQEIAQSTGSSLDPEKDRKRVRIYGGNFNNALSKLMNLEKLLVSYLCFNLDKRLKLTGITRFTTPKPLSQGF
jgi:hypothetical protein